MKSHLRLTALAYTLLFCSPATSEIIRPSAGTLHVAPGDVATLGFFLDKSATPLFGYSLDLTTTPLPDATGALFPEVAVTTFMDERNLITAGGKMRDPLFSIIRATPTGGLLISTNTDDGSTVLAAADINDGLASTGFRPTPDASGQFLISLGTGTALSDGRGFAVPYHFDSVVVTIVPSPNSAAALLTLVASRFARRRPRLRCLS